MAISYTPIQDRIEALAEILDYLTHEYTEDDDGMERAMQDRLAAAREELAASDEMRDWTLTEDSFEFATVHARSLRAARKMAHAEMQGGDYDTSDGTAWAECWVVCEASDERELITVQIDPPEPDGCDHDWQSPYSLLGGIKENPGVWGHGGGVIIRECCAKCGIYRERDTWAQGPGGEEGLESVRYEDADDASLAWIESQA